MRAADGMTPSTARSTAERFTWLVTMANGALTTAEPISHAMSSTDSTLTTAPATESITVAGRQFTRERTAAPSADASNWPIMAATNTATMATRACWVVPCTSERASFGANVAPMAAPPRKPAKLRMPTMKPCRSRPRQTPRRALSRSGQARHPTPAHRIAPSPVDGSHCANRPGPNLAQPSRTATLRAAHYRTPLNRVLADHRRILPSWPSPCTVTLDLEKRRLELLNRIQARGHGLLPLAVDNRWKFRPDRTTASGFSY